MQHIDIIKRAMYVFFKLFRSKLVVCRFSILICFQHSKSFFIILAYRLLANLCGLHLRVVTF